MAGTQPPSNETLRNIASVAPDWKVVGTANFNNSGQDDILWKRADGLVTIWQMEGLSIESHLPGGSFAPAILNPSPTKPFLGDFNGDVRPDILWQGWRPSPPGDPLDPGGSSKTWVMTTWTMAPGTAAPASIATSTSTTSWVAAVGQFDGSGPIDQFRRGLSSTSSFRINGGVINPGPNVGAAEDVAATGDFNADGTTDLVWHNHVTGDVSIWRIQAGAYAASPFYIRVPLDWQIVGTGDMDGDSVSDLVWRHTGGAMAVWLFSNFQVKDWGGSGFFVPTDWEWNGVLETQPTVIEDKAVYCCATYSHATKKGTGCARIVEVPIWKDIAIQLCKSLWKQTTAECDGGTLDPDGNLNCS
jgi:hypothetical protein